MNKKSKNIIACLLVAAAPWAASAQTHLKPAFNQFVKSKGVEISRELSSSKDPETNKKTAQCDIYYFKMHKSRRQLIDNLVDAFEQDRDEAYSVAMGDGRKPTPQEAKWWKKFGTAKPAVTLAVGDDTGRSVGLGYEGSQYFYSLFADPDEQERTHRYAYAMEWTPANDSISGKLVVTYAVRKEKREPVMSFSIKGSDLEKGLGALDSLLNEVPDWLFMDTEKGKETVGDTAKQVHREEATKRKAAEEAVKKARKRAAERAAKARARARQKDYK